MTRNERTATAICANSHTRTRMHFRMQSACTSERKAHGAWCLRHGTTNFTRRPLVRPPMPLTRATQACARACARVRVHGVARQTDERTHAHVQRTRDKLNQPHPPHHDTRDVQHTRVHTHDNHDTFKTRTPRGSRGGEALALAEVGNDELVRAHGGGNTGVEPRRRSLCRISIAPPRPQPIAMPSASAPTSPATRACTTHTAHTATPHT